MEATYEVKPAAILTVLRETTLFGTLEDEILAALADAAAARRYKARETIFHEGDPGDALLIVAEGAVKVFVTSVEGKEMVMATMTRPDTLGELALLDGGPRSASAVALQPTTTVSIAGRAFLDLLKKHPQLLEEFHRSLGTRLRHVLEQASDLVFLDLAGRTAKLLLSLVGDGNDNVEAALQVTQGDLARMVGGARPTVNQILKSFEARGYISFDKNKVVVRDPAALRRRADR